MKLTCKGEDLSKAAAWAAKIAPGNPVTPVLAGVKLTAGDDLELAASDFETFGTARCPAVVQQSGSAVVSARLLAEVAKRVPAGAEVSLVADGTHLEVRSGRPKWSLPEIDAELWPTWPAVGDVIGRVDAETLVTALDRVIPAADAEGKTKNEILRGVSCEFGHDELILSATNKYRLARLPVPWSGPEVDCDSAVVPIDVLRHVGTDGDVTVCVNDGIITFGTRQLTVTSRLLAGKYPALASVLDQPEKKANTGVVVDVQELRAAIDRTAVMMGEFSHLTMEFTGDGVALANAGGGEKRLGDADDGVDVQSITGDPIRINVKPQYIGDALACLRSPSASFVFTSSDVAGFLIRPCDAEGNVLDEYRHVLMPLNLREKS